MKSRVRKDEAEDRNSMLSSKTFYEMVHLRNIFKKEFHSLASYIVVRINITIYNIV